MKVAVLSLIGLWAGATALAQGDPQPLKTLADQPLPLQVAAGTIHSFGSTSELDATLSASIGGTIEKASFYLVIVNAGRVAAGEEWVESNPGSSIHRETKEALHPGDRAYLVVRSVTIGKRTASLDAAELSSHLNSILRNQVSAAPQVFFSMIAVPGVIRVQGTTPFCDGAQSAANNACGSGGIASFSCNASTQSYSYTCKGNKVVQPGPGSN